MAHVKYSPGNIQIWHTQKVEPYKNEKLCKKLKKVICHELAEWFLTLFRMGIFGAAHGWGPERPLPPLPKICHTYPSMVKLGTVIPYLKKIQKIYKSCDISLSSTDISIFSTEISKFCYIKKYRYKMHFGT